MVKNDVTEQCLARLDEVADRFSRDPRWRELADRLRDQLAQDARVGEPVCRGGCGDAVAAGRLCVCCRQRETQAPQGLCPGCQEIYVPYTARVISDDCDCGHEPEGAWVYVVVEEGRSSSLCGARCVRDHWKRNRRPFNALSCT